MSTVKVRKPSAPESSLEPLCVILRMLSLIGAVPFTLQRRGKATRGPFGFGAVQTFKYSVVATVNVMLMCALITYSSRLFGGLEQSKQFGKDLGFGETDQLAKSISNSWVALMIFPIAASFYGMSKKFNGIFSDIASLKTCKPGAEDLESMKKWIYGNLFLYVLILSYTLGASFLSGFLVMPEFSLRARWAFGSLYSLSIVTTWMGPTVMSAHFMFAYTSHFLIGCFKAWSRCISDPTRDMTFVHLIHSKPPECDPREQQAARKQLLPIENVVLEGIKLTKLVDQFNLASGWMAFFEIGTCFISEIFLYFFLMSAIDLIHNYKLAVFLHVLTFSGAAIFILLRKLNLHLSSQKLVNEIGNAWRTLQDWKMQKSALNDLTTGSQRSLDVKIEVLEKFLDKKDPLKPLDAFSLTTESLIGGFALLLTYSIVLVQLRMSETTV